MSEERLPERVMEARPIGTRSKGRPRTEWSEYMISVASNKAVNRQHPRQKLTMVGTYDQNVRGETPQENGGSKANWYQKQG